MTDNTCAPFGVYGIKNVAFTIDGVSVKGFAEGDDVISIERTTELGKPIIGADGTSILSITADESATVTIKLLPNSPHHSWLQGRARRQRANPSSSLVFAIGFVDMSNGESGGCTQAMVSKEPSIQRGANASEVEWQIFCPCWQPGEVTITR
jgi:hypothetical protein